MLSKALRLQQEKKEIELSTLQDEVEKLWSSIEEKEVEITSLKEMVAEAEKLTMMMWRRRRDNTTLSMSFVQTSMQRKRKLLVKIMKIRSYCWLWTSCEINASPFPPGVVIIWRKFSPKPAQLPRPSLSPVVTLKGHLVRPKKNEAKLKTLSMLEVIIVWWLGHAEWPR